MDTNTETRSVSNSRSLSTSSQPPLSTPSEAHIMIASPGKTSKFRHVRALGSIEPSACSRRAELLNFVDTVKETEACSIDTKDSSTSSSRTAPGRLRGYVSQLRSSNQPLPHPSADARTTAKFLVTHRLRERQNSIVSDVSAVVLVAQSTSANTERLFLLAQPLGTN